MSEKTNQQLHTTFYITYPDAILVLHNGVITSCNSSALKFFQETENNLIGQKLVSFIAKDTQKEDIQENKLISYFNVGLENTDFFECIIQNKEGKKSNVNLFLTKIEAEGQTFIQALLRDITAQKQKELEARTKNEELVSLEKELRQNLEELETQRYYTEEVNKDIKAKSDIVEKNNQVLLDLNKSDDTHTGNLDIAFELITKTIAQNLAIERVCIWEYDQQNEKIISQKQYQKNENGYEFILNEEIRKEEAPIYFEDIVSEQNIVAHNAKNHPALVEFVDNYLIPLQIDSMLDVPYFIDGKLAGVICCETQDQYKNWTLEDISFVKGVADSITIAIKTKQQVEEQEKVRKNEKLLFQFLNSIPVGVTIFSKKGERFFDNDMSKKMLGYDPQKGSLEERDAAATQTKIIGTDQDYPQDKFPHTLALQGQTAYIDDLELVKGTNRILLEINAAPIYSEDGQIEFAITAFQDITQRKASELEIKEKNQELAATDEELRQNLEELQATQEAMREKQIAIEEARILLQKQNTKLEGNEAVMRKVFEKMKEQDVKLRESLNASQAQEEELRQNMEELQATQESLLKTQLEQEKLVSIIKNVDAFVAITDLEGKTEFLNEKGKELSGFGEEYKGKPISDFHDEEGARIAAEVIVPAVMQKGFWKGEHKIQNHATKELFYTIANVFVIQDPNTQQPIALATVQLDITEQKNLEKSIQEQNEKLQASEEELRQNMEELQATQESMSIKQLIIEDTKAKLEKQNGKLEANEAVLKKAFTKMKEQDVKLRESLNALQTQEEELRQNMEELQTTQEVMAYQKDILEISNRQITKSISYAQTIQNAFLPSKIQIRKVLPESFVIYKPKDIVSGDFYWFSEHSDKTTDKIIVGVIDCTGHGVPGAFMSLVASNILNEIINQKEIFQPNLILQELHKGVVKKLHQKEGANNDGMDLTLCVIEKMQDEQTKLTFASVKQNLYIIRNQELIELKGNRHSIGGGNRDENRSYIQEEIMLQKNDSVFLATDGYADQANEERKSFSKKRFRELLLEIGHLPTKQQKKILENSLAEHQKTTDQRDDITVLGFKV